MRKMYTMDEARQYFTTVSDVQDEYVMTEIEAEEIIQPANSHADWTPKGGFNFKPEIIKVRDFKVDLPLKLKALEKKWIGYLKTNGSSPEEYPFVAYLLDYQLERIMRDLNKATIKGVYTPPTDGTPGAAIHSFDGIEKVYNDAVTAGKITVNPTGALLKSTIIDQVEETYDSVDSEFKDQELVMLISRDWRREYFRAKRGEFGQNVDYQAADPVIDFTNCRMVSPLHMNTGKIMITPASNLLLCEDGVEEEMEIRSQMNRRTLELMVDGKRGVGFGITEGLVWGNDQ